MILEWAFGYVTGKVADKFLAIFKGDPLSQALGRCLEDWREAIPSKHALAASEALFPSHLYDFQIADRPCLIALRQQLKENRLPSADLWAQALIEQWKFVVRTVEEPQEFFKISEEEAQQYLTDLSRLLYETASLHANLFNPEVLRLLSSILEGVECLGNPVSKLQVLAKWQSQVYEVKSLVRAAMDAGDTWPGTHIDLVTEEHEGFLSIYSFVANNAVEDSAELVTRFRENPTAELGKQLAILVGQLETVPQKS